MNMVIVERGALLTNQEMKQAFPPFLEMKTYQNRGVPMLCPTRHLKLQSNLRGKHTLFPKPTISDA